MTTRMLIDARHREETRVAVVKGNRIEEFDFESAEHKQLKGNIYLAKVMRVEPSLQAAFIDFGGNRHGFLAFSEIHPDYYQIPREDREELLAAEAEAAQEEADAREREEDDGDNGRDSDNDDDAGDEPELVEVDKDVSVDTIDVEEGELPDTNGNGDESDDDDADDDGKSRRGRGKSRGRGRGGSKAKASDEARAKRMALRRRYKIQDVIHRRQVLLVQVVKEERGNKGAALTTYLSLAGRYCVLMPNTSHGGGISRKISNASDRKKLKSIVSDLNLPRTMGCIIRTAGMARTKTEIKRDFDYLARLWDEIREQTLKSAAPALIHSDSELIKRAIRDIYNREIDEVMVEGEEGYRAAKDFMKLLMPSHARRVKQYADPVPLFQRYGVEDQLSAMYHPVVQLKSGGYIVINPTEALVSIDINSGKSTKEHGIEQTALGTNMEAAREVARQLRLRDMAGLVVIDFIDMEKHGNVRKVERALKDALKSDRARIQVGRISSFGLMEMSRQRLRTGVLEASTRECPHCEGTGLVRTASSAGLSALRHIEEEAAKGKGREIVLRASQEATIYVLNSKRHELAEIEERYGVAVEILPNSEAEGAKMTVSSAGGKPDKQVAFAPIVDEEPEEIEDEADETEDEDDGTEEKSEPPRRSRRPERSDDDEDEDGKPKRKRRRRGRRGGRGRKREERSEDQTSDDTLNDTSANEAKDSADAEAGEKPIKPRRGRTKKSDEAANEASDDSEASDDKVAESEADEKPKRKSRARKPKADQAEAQNSVDAAPESEAKSEDKPKRRRTAKSKTATKERSDAEEKPKPKPRTRKSAAARDAEPAVAAMEHVDTATAPAPKAKPSTETKTTTRDGPARKGWWQRTFG